MTAAPERMDVPCGPGQVCVTCADEGVALRVVSVDATGLAVCRGAEGVEREVETALVGASAVGDEVLVHAGVAIARLPPGAAGR